MRGHDIRVVGDTLAPLALGGLLALRKRRA
jgi:hypothetical protein